MIKAVKKAFGDKPLIGVEIGVSKGINAENILETLNISKLYLVDPYQAYAEYGVFLSKEKEMRAFAEARSRLKHHKEKIGWILKKSEDAAKIIPDQLDFVYIDGNHNYPYVKKDIELYYPKVKSGGYLGGHDYSMRYFGVIKAVNEFLKTRNHELCGLPPFDWWIIKT